MNATLVFADQSGFSLLPTVRRTGAPRGQTPIIKHRFNWKRLHAVGAIGCRADGLAPRLHMQVQAGPANGETTLHFIDSLRREFDGHVILIWDGLPAHRAKLVNDYVKNQDWLTLVRLPAYAPELNPVEYLWAAMKTKYTANVSDDTIEALSNRIERAYNRYCSETQTLCGFLKAATLWE